MDPSTWLTTLPDVQCLPSGECHFGDPISEAARALNATIAVPLSHLGSIRVRGADADTFLQGQLSNDVRRVTRQQAQLTSLSSAKGRLLAIGVLARDAAGLHLELHRSVLESIRKRLQMFVLRAKVQLGDETDRVGIGVAGPEAAMILAQMDLAVPTALLECASTGDITVMHRHGAIPRYSVLAPLHDAPKLWNQLRAQTTPAGSQAWRLLDILAGVPVIHPATQERFVAQMCNLDALGAISFDKGCYTGQEVIARVHYRGAVKRHMSMVRTPQMRLEPGSTVESAAGHAEVVDAAPHPEGGSAALVVRGEGT